MLKRYRIYDWWWNRRRHRTPRNDPPRGVLLISSGGLGDTVLFAHVVERFAALARAYGAAAWTVTQTDQFAAALDDSLAHDGPTLIHLKTDIRDISAYGPLAD